MPDALGTVLATQGLGWLLLDITVAGLVRGFTGFGSALIFVPVAGIFLPPGTVIGLMILTDISSTAALMPRAWGQSDRAEVGVMAFAALLTVPVGLWLLGWLPHEAIRWVVAGVAGITLGALVSGWRFHGRLSRPGLGGVGGAAGVIGGLTGMSGPVVILFYLAGQAAAQTVRANTILFLGLLDAVILVNLLWRGVLTAQTAVLAGVLTVPYLITTLIGQRLFDPRHEGLYRWAAYGVIGLAVLSGLPIWPAPH